MRLGHSQPRRADKTAAPQGGAAATATPQSGAAEPSFAQPLSRFELKLVSGPGKPSPAQLSAAQSWPEITCLKSDIVKICPTPNLVKNAGFATKMDINLAIVLPSDLKMAAGILTLSCESCHGPWNFKLSRICRDQSPAMCPPKI